MLAAPANAMVSLPALAAADPDRFSFWGDALPQALAMFQTKTVAPVVASAARGNPLAVTPLQGHKITSPYGNRIHPIFHRKIYHSGMDFRARFGDPVRCVLDGIVVHAGWRGGFGRAVYVYHPISHNTSVYGHLSRVALKPGQIIKQGQVVGLAGASGYATAVHLHFGVKNKSGHWQDPNAFLSNVPRLQSVAMRLPETEKHSLLAAALPRSKFALVKSSPKGKPPYVIPAFGDVIAQTSERVQVSSSPEKSDSTFVGATERLLAQFPLQQWSQQSQNLALKLLSIAASETQSPSGG